MHFIIAMKERNEHMHISIRIRIFNWNWKHYCFRCWRYESNKGVEVSLYRNKMNASRKNCNTRQKRKKKIFEDRRNSKHIHKVQEYAF